MAPESTASTTADKTSTTPSADRAGRGAIVPEGDRDEMASKAVDRFSIWAGAAGLVPVPVLDIAAVAAVQLQMLRRLSQIYDVPFTENRGKAIIAALSGSVIPASSTMGIASALKAIPAVGTAVSTAVMPFASAGATWVIGKVFIQHFASGGTLLDFNPPDYREFIKAQKEKWKARKEGATTESSARSPSASSTRSA